MKDNGFIGFNQVMNQGSKLESGQLDAWNNEFKHEQRNNVLISTCNHGNNGRFENNTSE